MPVIVIAGASEVNAPTDRRLIAGPELQVAVGVLADGEAVVHLTDVSAEVA
jgi:hypothetical protein